MYIGQHLTWDTWEDQECVQEIYIIIHIGNYYLHRKLSFKWDTWEDEEGVQGDAQDHWKGVEKELMQTHKLERCRRQLKRRREETDEK
jgi:hypothetical protein